MSRYTEYVPVHLDPVRSSSCCSEGVSVTKPYAGGGVRIQYSEFGALITIIPSFR